jgi:hypothetical protein
MWQTQGILSGGAKSGRRSIVTMTEPDSPKQGLPHQIDHRHADVTGGWLRAATFGAMDGLVSNTALIAGVAASASTHAIILAGVAGLLAATRRSRRPTNNSTRRSASSAARSAGIQTRSGPSW